VHISRPGGRHDGAARAAILAVAVGGVMLPVC